MLSHHGEWVGHGEWPRASLEEIVLNVAVVLAVVQVGSLFSSDAWNNVTFTAGEIQNPKRNLPSEPGVGNGCGVAAVYRVQLCVS